jgi:hypothetical protein
LTGKYATETQIIEYCALHASATKLRDALEATLPYVIAMEKVTMPAKLVDKAKSVAAAVRAVLAETEE